MVDLNIFRLLIFHLSCKHQDSLGHQTTSKQLVELLPQHNIKCFIIMANTKGFCIHNAAFLYSEEYCCWRIIDLNDLISLLWFSEKSGLVWNMWGLTWHSWGKKCPKHMMRKKIRATDRCGCCEWLLILYLPLVWLNNAVEYNGGRSIQAIYTAM